MVCWIAAQGVLEMQKAMQLTSLKGQMDGWMLYISGQDDLKDIT